MSTKIEDMYLKTGTKEIKSETMSIGGIYVQDNGFGETIIFMYSYSLGNARSESNHNIVHQGAIYETEKSGNTFTYSSTGMRVQEGNYRTATPKEMRWLINCINEGCSVEEPTEEKITKFVKGEYYTNGRSFIFKASDDGHWTRNCHYIDGHSYNTCGSFSVANKFKATPYEIIWLDACIEAGEFVTKEEAIRKYITVKDSRPVLNRESINKTIEHVEASTIKVKRLISRVTEGPRPSGTAISSRTRRATIEVRPLSYGASVIKS